MSFESTPESVLENFTDTKKEINFRKGFFSLIIRNLKIIWEYKFSLVLGFTNFLIAISLAYYLSKLVPEQSFSQDNYTVDSFSFIFLGVVLVELSSKILMKSLGSFTNEIKQGTFETLATMPYGLKRYFISEIAFEVMYAIVQTFLFLLPICFIFPVFNNIQIHFFSILSTIVVLGFIMFFFFSLSLVAGNFTVLNKRGREISMIIVGVLYLLSGSIFPLSIFPTWLRFIAYLSPLTTGIRAFRLCFFGQGIITDPIVWQSLLVLFFGTLVCIVLFKLSFNKIYNRVRTTGSTHEF
ncbi:MAG: ABC transporter permease [Candidatus Heimdallarchaeaceae archaeon]